MESSTAKTLAYGDGSSSLCSKAEIGIGIGGDDRKVVYNGDGISLVVEVSGEKICGCEDNKFISAQNGAVLGSKFTEIPNCISDVGENCDIIDVKGRKQEINTNGDEMGDQDCPYVVGDFVWGKIRNLFSNYSWWPGRIYDPSDASEYAAKYKREDRSLLVAYFGDGSFSWCHPSQLKPFAENFEEMAKQSSSKSFVNAVQEALDEIGWIVASEITCLCVLEENRTRVATKPVNAGIRPGVVVPEGGIGKQLIELLHEPAELLASVRNFAQLICTDSLLELTLLKSWLTAFYRAKGRYQLPIYHEPKYIEGLEDNERNGVKAKSGFCEPTEVSVQVPFEVDGYSSPMISTEFEQFTKVQSVENGNVKRGKANDGTLLRAAKRKKVSNVENEDSEDKEETAKSFSSRNIKRSRYLSPPYTQFPEELGIELETIQEDHKISINSVKLNPTLNEVLSEVRSAALDPFYLRDNKHLDMITRTIFTFRSLMFLNLPASSEPLEPKSQLGKNQMNKRKKMDVRKFKRAGYGTKANDKRTDSSVALVLTFPPGVSLPSKGELIKIFGNYGALNEMETEVIYDSFYARVAFLNSCDAEEAFTKSVEKSPFGATNVNFRLCYSLATSRAHEFNQKAISSPLTNTQGNRFPSKLIDDEGSQLGYVRQKLEMMASMLEEDGRAGISAETKSELEGEMKDLLEIVSRMIGSNSSS